MKNIINIILVVMIMLLFFSCCMFSARIDPVYDTLPPQAKDSVLWHCDYESGDLAKWEDAGTDNYFSGGGIFITDEANTDYGISTSIYYSGDKAGYASIFNAIEPGDPKAVRYMRWTDKAWDNDGDYFPDEAYYSVFIYMPETYDPAKPADNDPFDDGGWWNIFQFKSDNNAGSQPVVVLDLYNEEGVMYLGLAVKDYTDDDSEEHTQVYRIQDSPVVFASKKWIHLEAFYKKSRNYDGSVKIWQDGEQIFSVDNVRTMLPPAETTAWGIGNYTDYISSSDDEGSATVYFDDAIVSTVRMGEYLF